MAFFSSSSNDYAQAINSLTKPKYTSKYGTTIEELMNKIANREQFSYDFNADPLYQNYKDSYTKLGNEAAQNAAAAVATQTGGYGNSYAATAATQANQQYLTQLNNVIPELYNAAMNKYKMETEDLYNQFGMYETEENRLYGQYRDKVSDYYSDWGNLQSGYGTALSHEEWLEEMEFQKDRAAVSDAQWQQTFDNDNYWKQLNYELSKSKSGGSGSSKKASTTSTSSKNVTVPYKTYSNSDVVNAVNSASQAINSYQKASGSNLTDGVKTASGMPFITNALNDTDTINRALQTLNSKNLSDEEYKAAYERLIKQYKK